MKKTFKDARIGDRVWSIVRGWGTVVRISNAYTYPLIVGYNDSTEGAYTFDGLANVDHINPELFWDEVKIEIPEKPLQKLEVDTKVIVWNDDSSGEYNRYFSHLNEDGKIRCFADGTTSWSSSGFAPKWNHWRLAE
jgi:hypothetical protein